LVAPLHRFCIVRSAAGQRQIHLSPAQPQPPPS
jgi:hypothetical protein